MVPSEANRPTGHSCQRPFSRSTTSRPFFASSRATVAPPGPEPTTTTQVSVPVAAQGRVLGVLSLYDREDGEPFTLADAEAERLSVTDPLTGAEEIVAFTGDRDGARALAGFGSAKGSNEEAYLFQKLVRTGFGSNNVDHCTRLCHASSVAALLENIGSGAVTAPFAAAKDADEAVRVAAAQRGSGVGRAMMLWAIEQCRARGCGLVQLTTDKRRTAAQRFYASLGFEATHEGMKLSLPAAAEPE